MLLPLRIRKIFRLALRPCQAILLQDALLILECKPNCTHAHSRTIAPTVVGARVFRMEPPIEEAAVSGIRVAPADLADRFKIRATRQDRVCDSNGEHGVIGEVTERAKQREILRLDRTKPAN